MWPSVLEHRYSCGPSSLVHLHPGFIFSNKLRSSHVPSRERSTTRVKSHIYFSPDASDVWGCKTIRAFEKYPLHMGAKREDLTRNFKRFHPSRARWRSAFWVCLIGRGWKQFRREVSETEAEAWKVPRHVQLRATWRTFWAGRHRANTPPGRSTSRVSLDDTKGCGEIKLGPDDASVDGSPPRNCF